MLLAHHITIGQALSLACFSAGIGVIVADVRARERNERQAQLQHAAYELGKEIALDRTHVSA